jgi:DNA-binding response OmpR family regulator
MPRTILICEDDLALSDMLQRLLREKGYDPQVVHSGAEALEVLQTQRPALLLLDLMLPDMDGFDVCRRVREHSAVPVIMISGRSSDLDRIIGLEIGADDYLAKPFGVRELVARVEAKVRRDRVYAHQESPAGWVRVGDICIDPDAHEVEFAGAHLHLTPKEFDLLWALTERRGTVVRSAQLLLQVWGYDSRIRTRTLDVHIGRLRAKIETDTRHPRYIVTVPGVGYKLCTPEPAAHAA